VAYVYEISFDIPADQAPQLKIGASLQRVLGYLRSLLPNIQGYITTRAMYSLTDEPGIHMVFQSVWNDAEYLNRHLESRLEEQKVLLEFAPNVQIDNLCARVYEEIE
jgi:hypothetical protein